MTHESPLKPYDALRARVREAIRRHGSIAVARALQIDRIAALGIAAEADSHRGTLLIAQANVAELDALDREAGP